jgi:ankyrin repeat protein
LDHLSVARVKDWDGNTPLHLLAKAGSEKALTHSEATRVYNGQNKTPKNMFKPKD